MTRLGPHTVFPRYANAGLFHESANLYAPAFLPTLRRVVGPSRVILSKAFHNYLFRRDRRVLHQATPYARVPNPGEGVEEYPNYHDEKANLSREKSLDVYPVFCEYCLISRRHIKGRSPCSPTQLPSHRVNVIGSFPRAMIIPTWTIKAKY